MALHAEEERLCRLTNDPGGLYRCLGNQAIVLRQQGDLDGAIRINKEVELICRRLNAPIGLQACIGNQGVIHMFMGDMNKALASLRTQEGMCRELNRPQNLIISLANQARILAYSVGRPAEAAAKADEAYMLSKATGLSPLVEQIGSMLADIRRLIEATDLHP